MGRARSSSGVELLGNVYRERERERVCVNRAISEVTITMSTPTQHESLMIR